MMSRQSSGARSMNDHNVATCGYGGSDERGGEEVRPRKFEEQVRSGRDTSTVSQPGLPSRTGRVYALHVGARADVFASAAYHAKGGVDRQISHQYQERRILFARRMAAHSSEE